MALLRNVAKSLWKRRMCPLAFRLEMLCHASRPSRRSAGKIFARGLCCCGHAAPTCGTPEFRTETDAGAVCWGNDVPRDEVLFGLSARGFMSDRDHLSDGLCDEHTVTLHPELVIRGTVVDAESGKPIDKFQYCSGFCRDTEKQSFFSNHFTAGKNGRFYLDTPRGHAQHLCQSRGRRLLAGHFPRVPPHGRRTAFRLQIEEGERDKRRGIAARRQAVNNATVALVSKSSHPFIKNGACNEIVPGSGFGPTPPGDSASCRKPSRARSSPCTRAAKPNSPSMNLKSRAPLTSQPWGRLEGMVKIGKQAAKNVGVTLSLGRFAREGGSVSPL